jgi:hypothetical protein
MTQAAPPDAALGDATPASGSSRLGGAVLPAWVDAAVLVLALGALALAIPGVVLAIANRYALAPTLFVALLLGALAVPVVIERLRTGAGASRSASVASALAAVVAIAAFAFNAAAPAQHVFIDRDPGAYTTAGRWLARDGTLEPDVAVGAFAGVDGLRFDSIAVPASGEGTVQIQFNHTLPVLLAEAFGVGGERVLFRVPAVLGAAGLLAFYAVAARVLRRPWLALAAMATVAVVLPQAAFSRDTFSEPLTQLWLWAGLLAVLVAYERRSWRFGLAGGLLLGATAMARIDGLAYLAALPVLAVLAVRLAPVPQRRSLRITAAAAFAGAVATAAIGWLDLAIRGTAYEEGHAGLLAQLRLGLLVATAVAVGLALAWDRLAGVRSWLVTHRDVIGRVAAGLTLVVLLAAWFVRPLVQKAHSPVSSGTIGQIQADEGVTVSSSRSYDEDTMRWIAWYFGPLTLGLAVLGVARAARRIASGRASAALLVTTLVAGPAALLYLWRPNAAPDHVWVMRRFVPAALPLFALFAMVALGTALRASRSSPRSSTSVTGPSSGRQPVVLGLVGVAVAVGLVWSAGSTWPVRAFHDQRPFLESVEGICAIAGPDAAILMVDDGSPISGVISGGLPMSLRAWCGVPVATAEPGFTGEQVLALAASWRNLGRTLVLAAPSSEPFGRLVEGRTVQDSPLVVNDHALARTLTHAPDRYRTEQLGIALLRLD